MSNYIGLETYLTWWMNFYSMPITMVILSHAIDACDYSDDKIILFLQWFSEENHVEVSIWKCIQTKRNTKLFHTGFSQTTRVHLIFDEN